MLPVACTPPSSAAKGIPFEVQIRTWDMDHTAEYGIAAHWKYKAGITSGTVISWTSAWPGCASCWKASGTATMPTDLLQRHQERPAAGGSVCFHPARATSSTCPPAPRSIDFAYAIHSAVGNRMVGAKVNSRIVPIDHKVQTGEIIEIITGPEGPAAPAATG